MNFRASIIIASYQAANCLPRAIASAQGQTCADIEILVVDDGSTDATPQVIDRFARADPRVRGLRNPTNLGPGAARNLGLRHARGDWIAILDADDTFLPDRIERMAAQATAAGADLLADNLLQVDFDTGAPLGADLAGPPVLHDGPLGLAEMVRRDMPDMIGRTQFGFLKPIIRRSFLERTGIAYNEDLRAGEDFLLAFTCVARGARYLVVPEAWYVYAVRGNSISSRPDSSYDLNTGNRRMLAMADRRDSALLRALRRRQGLLDFSCFRLRLREGRLLAALPHAARVPPAYMSRRVGAAIGRRLVALGGGGAV